MDQNSSSLFTLIALVKAIGIIGLLGGLTLFVIAPFADSLDKSIKSATTPLPQSAYEAALKDYNYTPQPKVVNGVHLASGMAHDKNFKVVHTVCTRCHSAKLITQARATREGWRDMIRWMQKTQGLEDLNEFEPVILDYLSTHYAPEYYGRRANLDPDIIDWYTLETN